MKLTIKYFGMLAEATAIAEEQMHVNSCTIADLLNTLENQYPKLQDKNFKVAVDHVLVDKHHIIRNEVEIALLPPFAGG